MKQLIPERLTQISSFGLEVGDLARERIDALLFLGPKPGCGRGISLVLL